MNTLIPRTEINGDGNVIGRGNIIQLVKAEGGSTIHDVVQQVFVGDYEGLRDAYIHPWPVFERVQFDHFVGREWILAEIDAFLRQNKRGYFILEAEAGLGKTTFLAWLVRNRGYIHHFSELAPGTENVGRSLKNLAAQIVLEYNLDAYKVLSAAAAQPPFFHKLLKEVADQRQDEEKIVLVVDALDEAGTPPHLNVLGLPEVLPEGVFIIASQRPVQVALKVDVAKTARCLLRLTASSAENQADIHRFLEEIAIWPRVAQALQASNYTVEQFITTLQEKCRGLWIYLHFVIAEINKGDRFPLDLEALPNGLTQVYVQYWQRWRDEDEDAWDEIYLPILTTLAAAQEPLSGQRLMDWSAAKIKKHRLHRLLEERWRPFLFILQQGQEKRYRFYHATLQEFFNGRVTYDNLLTAEQSMIEELSAETRACHDRLADRYLQAWGFAAALKGLQDATLRDMDGGYGLRYIATHLATANRSDDLHRLLSAATSNQRNVWYEAKDATDDLTGYLADVQRAWRLAEVAFSSAHYADAALSIGRQCRYACMLSTINNLARNMPADLLTALIAHGVWPWWRALTYVNHIPDAKQRFEVMLDLSPIEDAELEQWLREIQKFAQEAEESTLRAAHRDDLAYCIQEIQKFAQEVEESRKLGLTRVAHMAEHPSTETTIDRIRSRRQARLATQRPDREPEQVVLHSLSISEFLGLGAEHNPYEQLLNEIPSLPKPKQQQAINRIMSKVLEPQQDSFLQKNLVCLFARVPALLSTEVLSVVRSIQNDYLRLEIMADLIFCITDEDRTALAQEMLEIVFATNAALTFGENVKRLAPYLSSSLLQQTLTALCKLENDAYARWKVRALAHLAPYLSGQDRETALNEAIRAVKGMRSSRQESLANLIPLLPKSLLPEAIKISQEIDDSPIRFFALLKLFPYLPEPKRTQAWNLCVASTPSPAMPAFLQVLGIEWGVKNMRHRLEALIEFAPVATEHEREIILKAVLAELRWVELEPGFLTQVVKAFPPHNHEAVVKQLLSAAQKAHIEQQAPMLVELLPFLDDESNREQILREALTKPTGNLRGERVIQRLAPLLPEKLVWAILQELRPRGSHFETTIPNPHIYIPKPYSYNPDPPAPRQQGSNLWNTIPELNIHRFSYNLALGFNLDDHEQASISFALIMRLAELGHAESAHQIAKAWNEEGVATLALTRLSPSKLMEAFEEFVRQEDSQTELAVPTFLVEQQGSKTDYSDRQRLSGADAYQAILAEFCIRLAASGHVRKVLDHACMKAEWFGGANVLSGIWRAKALSKIVMHLDNKEEARKYAQEITAPLWRARALIDITPKFKDEDQQYYEILQQAFAATLNISDHEERWKLLPELTSLVKTCSSVTQYELWKAILNQLSGHNRQFMIPELCRLAPMIAAIGGPEAVAYTLRAIAAVGRWWP